MPSSLHIYGPGRAYLQGRRDHTCTSSMRMHTEPSGLVWPRNVDDTQFSYLTRPFFLCRMGLILKPTFQPSMLGDSIVFDSMPDQQLTSY